LSVTLATLRQRFQTLYDVQGSAVLTATDGGEVDQLLNDGYRALWAEVTAVNKDFRVTLLPFTLTTVQTLSLPSDFREVRYVRRDPGTAQQVFLTRYNARAAQGADQRTYRLQGSLLYIEPLLRAAGSYSLDYGPQCPVLAVGADTLDAELEQFQDFIVYEAVIAALAREESDISQFAAKLNGAGGSDRGIRGRVHRWASDQRSADPSLVEDVRGGSSWRWAPPA
jgi:hypothetical protein